VRGFRFVLPIAFALFTSSLFADQVVLKNGDRLTGTIEKSDDKSLVIKTEFAGEVTVKWAAIQELKSEQPLHVGLKDGKTVVGPVASTDGTIEVSAKNGEKVDVPKESIVVMRSESQQTAWQKEQYPGLLEGWQGGITVGFGLTGGNSETRNLALAFNGIRTGLRDKLTLYEASVYSTNDLAPAATRVTANSNRGGARYDRDITGRLFGFVNTDLATDALQDLNLRYVLGGGLGVHLIKRDTTTLDILGGANYTHEDYTQPAPAPHLIHSFSAAQVGDEFLHKIGESTVITQRAFFYPDFDSAGEYRATFDLATVTKFNKWLGWQNSFGDVYVTNPPTGKKRNDLVFTTGLNVSFTH
jgi:putative salt-induced outer membrane protein YdiY